MKSTKRQIAEHFLIGPLGFRYRTILAALVAAWINWVLFPGSKYAFVIIMGAYLAFGITGLERKLLLRLLNRQK